MADAHCGMECCGLRMDDDSKNGVAVCPMCGSVRQIFNNEPEWRNPARERCDTSGLGSCDAQECQGTAVSGGGTLSKINRSLARFNRTVYEDVLRMNELCTMLRLDASLCQSSVELLKATRRHCAGVWRGNRRIALRAACVSIECQRASVGISDREIVCVPGFVVPIKCLNKQKKLVMTCEYNRNCKPVVELGRPHVHFGLRFCSQLGFDFRLASAICRRAQGLSRQQRLQSKPPTMIIAVATLDLLSRTRILNVQQICKVSGVTQPTLAKWYSDAYETTYSEARAVVKRMLT